MSMATRSNAARRKKTRLYVSIIAKHYTSAQVVCAAPVDATLKECWENHSHPEMSQCVNKRAVEARLIFMATEKSVRDGIAKNREDAEHSKMERVKFEASVKSFRKYREDQCRFHHTLASKGNGAAEIQRACEAELDTVRAAQLKAAMWWLE